MPKIFISYRRSASAGHAGRLYDRLIQEYGTDNVFLDVETIPLGETFESYILNRIDQSDIVLVLIGKGTLDRVVNDDDWVRREIAYALQHKTVVVVPVLQDGFVMPEADTLPEDIRAITSKNAAFLFHQLFDESVGKVIENINHTFAKTEPIPVPANASTSPVPIAGTGRITIHRPANMSYYARAFTIKINGNDHATIGNGKTVDIDLLPGDYTISVNVDYHHPEQQIHLQRGEIQEFQISLKAMGLSISLERV